MYGLIVKLTAVAGRRDELIACPPPPAAGLAGERRDRRNQKGLV